MPLLTMLKESSIRPGDQSPEKGVPHVSTKKPPDPCGDSGHSDRLLDGGLLAQYPSPGAGEGLCPAEGSSDPSQPCQGQQPIPGPDPLPDDPATGDLLALLEGQRYRPVYHNPWGAISGHPVALDYAIYGVFVFQGEDGGVSVPFYFDGYREVSIGSGGPFRKGYRLDPAVQQAVLDLLLAQPDTPA
ncbi:MAG: hypothetical protein ACLR1T_11145 [Evtepia gabavorous]